MNRLHYYPTLEPNNEIIETDDTGHIHVYADDGSEEVLAIPAEPVTELPNDNQH